LVIAPETAQEAVMRFWNLVGALLVAGSCGGCFVSTESEEDVEIDDVAADEQGRSTTTAPSIVVKNFPTASCEGTQGFAIFTGRIEALQAVTTQVSFSGAHSESWSIDRSAFLRAKGSSYRYTWVEREIAVADGNYRVMICAAQGSTEACHSAAVDVDCSP
jgi:hypothetical protein